MLVTDIQTVETNAQTASKGATFTPKERENYRRVWDKLQGDEHNLDLARARMLHEVWVRYDRHDEGLLDFMVSVLEEYKGKRCSALLRLAHAFDANGDAALWRAVGGRAMVLLTQPAVTGNRRRRIATKVQGTLKRTGREALSISTFRTIAQEVLGGDVYRAALTETKGKGPGCREKLQILRSFVLKLRNTIPEVDTLLTRDVKMVLGLDIVSKPKPKRQ